MKKKISDAKKARRRLECMAKEWPGVLQLFYAFLPMPVVEWIELYGPSGCATYFVVSIRAFDDARLLPLGAAMQITERFALPTHPFDVLTWRRLPSLPNPGLEWRVYARRQYDRSIACSHLPLVIHDRTGLPEYCGKRPLAFPREALFSLFRKVDLMLSDRVRYAFFRGRTSYVVGDHKHPPRFIFDKDPDDPFSPRHPPKHELAEGEYPEGDGRVLLSTARESFGHIADLLTIAHDERMIIVNSFAGWGQLLDEC